MTIKEIAKLAGVSTATVSMVMNNKDSRISPDTREKVLKVINDHNYVPNRIASSMRTKSTKTIGLVIPDIANPFFPEVARGAEDRANEDGYTVILCNSDDKLAKEDIYIDMLQEKMVDGIIFTASSRRTEVSSVLKLVRMPVITVDREISGLIQPGNIIVDNEKGAYEAVTYMLDSGYKRIFHISGPMTSKPSRERCRGYLRALGIKETDDKFSHVLEGQYTSEWGHEAVDKIINSGADFDGIFCGNDMIALGALKCLQEHGISVPGEVGIIGFDDIYMARIVTPELTTVRQPKYEMGYQAADMLINMINGHPVAQHDYFLETHLIIRGTTK